ncbi:hypothetical protein PAHAL_4G045700 [Panicum hallii]|jgi:hypothetical protein|uniref:Uncharacterized protein n=1 Tax=Panicum hallii TaxID=206008 RepID=A0A2T8JBS4_9POAL|nr:hypothetical protein PAHAL_4G045700 [Panicum hallii]
MMENEATEELGDLDGGRQVVGEGEGAIGEGIYDCDLIYSKAEEVGAAVPRSDGR